jgi:hypothetical protein
MSMLVDTTVFDWTSAAVDGGLILLAVLACIGWATHAHSAFSGAGPGAREMLWRTMQGTQAG